MAFDGTKRQIGAAWTKVRAVSVRAGSTVASWPWKRIGIWTGGALGVLITAFVLFLTFADWNAMRGPIARYASAATGRPIVIHGDLDVNPWSWTPEVRVNQLRIGNQERFRERGLFADVGYAEASFRWLPLLWGSLDIVRLDLRDTDVSLYRAADGDSNWSRAPGADRGKPFNLPAIREFSLRDGMLKLEDDKRRMNLEAEFTTSESADRRNPGRFELIGEGSINRRPFEITLTGAPLLNVRRDRPYDFVADVRAGPTHIVADGAISRPFDLSAFAANVRSTGSDLADLYYLIDLTLPNTPPYDLRGRVERRGDVYGMRDIAGRVGDSDLAGQFTASRHNAGRLLLEGAFTSRSLDWDDLMAVLGGAPDPDESASPEQRQIAANLAAQGRLLPDATLDISRVRNMDARVSYRAQHVRSETVPLRGLAMDINLDTGLLRLDPLTLELSQGRIGGAVAINARQQTPRVDLDVRLSNARIENVISMNGAQPITGALYGRARLSGTGASAHRAAANANGDVTLVIPNGEIREAFAELTGIDVTRGLGLLLADDHDKIDIRCGVASFHVSNGIASRRTLVVDTETMLIQGEGTASLRDETLNLRLQGQPKEPRLIRIAAPITIGGHLRSPQLGVEAGPLAGQGGVAAAIGALVAPLAAILPFVDPGLAEDANCQQLMAGGAQPSPQPG